MSERWFVITLLVISIIDSPQLIGEASESPATSLSQVTPTRTHWPAFKRHVVDESFPGAYQVSVADLDGDRSVDILALSINPTQLAWYKNPNWAKSSIDVKTRRNVDLAPHDIDGDGDMDLALISDFSLSESNSGGSVQWLEQVAATQSWRLHPIDAVPTSHRVRWADLDGDGNVELLNLPIIGVGATPPRYETSVVFKAYQVPEDPRHDPWPVTVLDRSLRMAHGIRVVDLDGDGRAEVLTASFGGVYLLQQSSGNWIRSLVGSGQEAPRPRQGASEVALGKLATNRFIATIEPWHGNKVVVYHETDPEQLPWPRRIIDTSFRDGHALLCADFDRDGSDEIVAGYRGAGYSLFIYRFSSVDGRWERIPLDEGGISAAGIVAADLNQDGWIDLVAAGAATHNVVWYENQGLQMRP